MFYVVRMKKQLDIHPRYFGKYLRDYIETTLYSEVEGTLCGTSGYVIAVIKIFTIGSGIIRNDSSGLATFDIDYECIVCKPFVGEVLDCVVENISVYGILAKAGPVEIFVTSRHLPDAYEFDRGDNTYRTDDESRTIKVGRSVRLRIIGINIQPNRLNCVGTLDDAYLGAI
mmetsp:Transcript_1252/g.1843  ORF Transcript_1252/g.1843 Transcript_1252/m.1843 type:complete len:171 (+) Transcript_1252:82-594(+)